MENYVELLSENASFSRMQRAICKIYYDTGKENSKFFPLLNYAAVKSCCGGTAYKEYEKSALKWVNDNLECMTVYLAGLQKNGYCSSLLYGEENLQEGRLHCGDSIIFGKDEGDMKRIMMVNNRNRDYRYYFTLSICWNVIIESVALMLQGSFQEALETNKRYVKTFMEDMKNVQRSIKDRKALNIDGTLPLWRFIERHGEYETGGSVIFPCIPYGPVFFDEELFICKYDRVEKRCTLFNKEKIMSFSSVSGLTCKEVGHEAAVYDLLDEYRRGVDYLNSFTDTIEKQRKRWLELV